MDNFIKEAIEKFNEVYEGYIVESKTAHEGDVKSIFDPLHKLGERVLNGELKSAKEEEMVQAANNNNNNNSPSSKFLKKKASTLEEFNDVEVTGVANE